MTLSDLSIKRPVLTWMMTLSLIVFGVLGFQRLGVDQFPDLEYPMIGVAAQLEGATPEGIEEDVVDVLEEFLNSIGGLRNIKSFSHSGSGNVMLMFELGADPDLVAQEARNKVAMARYNMNVDIEAPQVGKFDINAMPILWIPLETEMDPVAASEYLRRELKPRFETIDGVAGVEIFGRREREIRIWIDGDALRSRGLSATDLVAAIQREHIEIPAGRVEGRRVEYGVRTDAEFRSLEALGRLVISPPGTTPIYLSDVARVEDGSEDIRQLFRYEGRPMVGLGITRQSGSNTVAIVDEVYRRVEEVRPLLPRALRFRPPENFIDLSHSVREAVAETLFTLVFGALLAVFTVFVFLRRTRPTLIVAAAIPISLVATFGLVWLAGFTLNVLTLLGMSLAVGVVIDDAIVVLENIERHREGGKDAFAAAEAGTREIAFAATAATVAIAAVFLPVVFVEGIVGSFLGDFGLTVAGAVMISLFVALTLTPMLAARMPAPKPRPRGSLHGRLERGFQELEDRYKRALNWTMGHRIWTSVLAVVSIIVAGLCGWWLSEYRSEVFPAEDAGLILARMEAAPGTSVEAAVEYLAQDERWFMEQPEVSGFFAAVGEGGGGDASQPNRMMIFASLKPRHERERNVYELQQAAREALGNVPGRTVRVGNPFAVIQAGGSGEAQDFQFELRGHVSLDALARHADRFIAALEARGGYVDLDKSLKLGQPEIKVIPDRAKAAALGVDAREIARAIQLMIGGLDVAVFQDGTQRVDIRMRLDRDFRSDPEAIRRLYVRSTAGDVVELRNLVDIDFQAAPQWILRSQRQRAVEIGGSLVGKAAGPAISEAREVAQEIMPPEITFATTGMSKDFMESAVQFGLALSLGLIVIYMVLAAQFESFIHPLTVMLAVPLAMTGALGGLIVFGQTLNVFSGIGILLLFGLVTKNSILLVDYANQLRQTEGLDKVEAMRRAAPVRMRPVLMTALSMIFGVLPAALGVGPGSESRMPMAIATAAGMLSSTVLTLLVVPVFYVLIDDLGEWLRGAFLGARRERATT